MPLHLYSNHSHIKTTRDCVSPIASGSSEELPLRSKLIAPTFTCPKVSTVATTVCRLKSMVTGDARRSLWLGPTMVWLGVLVFAVADVLGMGSMHWLRPISRSGDRDGRSIAVVASNRWTSLLTLTGSTRLTFSFEFDIPPNIHDGRWL